MALTFQNPGTTSSGTTLSAPESGAYTSVPRFDERLLYSSEASANATGVNKEINMFDAIIGVAVIVIIGLVAYFALANTKKK